MAEGAGDEQQLRPRLQRHRQGAGEGRAVGEAMAYHKMARDQYNYSQSLKEYRKEWLRENFHIVFISIIVLFLVLRFGVPLLRKQWGRWMPPKESAQGNVTERSGS